MCVCARGSPVARVCRLLAPLQGSLRCLSFPSLPSLVVEEEEFQAILVAAISLFSPFLVSLLSFIGLPLPRVETATDNDLCASLTLSPAASRRSSRREGEIRCTPTWKARCTQAGKRPFLPCIFVRYCLLFPSLWPARRRPAALLTRLQHPSSVSPRLRLLSLVSSSIWSH